MSDDLPTQRILGEEYRSCEWCGAAVSQVGTRTPRLYCKRSHRERAFIARKHGEPMLKDRPVVPVTRAELPAPPPAPVLAVLPDPPAAAPVVVPLPAPKSPRRRSAASAPAIPDGVRTGLDPKGWLRAFDVYDERRQQASLFDGQEDEQG